jgi:selenoprotein W-related protein
MTDIEIEYCVPCGFLERASDLAETLLSSLGEELDRVSLVTGDRGVFRVTVDGEVVFDKDEDDYDVDAIVREVRAAT